MEALRGTAAATGGRQSAADAVAATGGRLLATDAAAAVGSPLPAILCDSSGESCSCHAGTKALLCPKMFSFLESSIFKILWEPWHRDKYY